MPRIPIRPLPFFLILALAALVAVANGLRTGTLTTRFKPSVAGLPAGVTMLTKAQVREAVAKKSHTILDVRPLKAYQAGHLPDALSLPYENLPARLEALGLNANGLYILYCDGGDCRASHGAARVMASIGFEHLAVYPGGWADWQAEGETK